MATTKKTTVKKYTPPDYKPTDYGDIVGPAIDRYDERLAQQAQDALKNPNGMTWQPPAPTPWVGPAAPIRPPETPYSDYLATGGIAGGGGVLGRVDPTMPTWEQQLAEIKRQERRADRAAAKERRRAKGELLGQRHREAMERKRAGEEANKRQPRQSGIPPLAMMAIDQIPGGYNQAANMFGGMMSNAPFGRQSPPYQGQRIRSGGSKKIKPPKVSQWSDHARAVGTLARPVINNAIQGGKDFIGDILGSETLEPIVDQLPKIGSIVGPIAGGIGAMMPPGLGQVAGALANPSPYLSWFEQQLKKKNN